jgi:hypothetical protein
MPPCRHCLKLSEHLAGRDSVLSCEFYNVYLSPNSCFASAYLPAAILVLAGSLLGGTKQKQHSEGPYPVQTVPEHWSSSLIAKLVAIMATRFVLMPTATQFAVALLAKRWPILAADRVLVFVLLLQASKLCTRS